LTRTFRLRPALLSLAVLILGSLVSCSARDTDGGDTEPPEESARAELAELTAELPQTIRERITSDPRSFLEVLAPVLEKDPDFLRLVDKNHPLEPDYEPDDLVLLDDTGLSVSRPGHELRRAILIDLNRMDEAARKEGITLLISSAYRSYSYQESVFERHVEAMGRDEASRVSAEPGKSQHQLGTTIDFGSITPEYAATPAGKWLGKNAWRYGFSLSYPEGMEAETGYMHECWHFRYITPEATLLERLYFDGIQQYMLEFLHENRETLEGAAVSPSQAAE
jgi:zinc D-Ala-D-Ala carboxypeptidase